MRIVLVVLVSHCMFYVKCLVLIVVTQYQLLTPILPQLVNKRLLVLCAVPRFGSIVLFSFSLFHTKIMKDIYFEPTYNIVLCVADQRDKVYCIFH